MIKSSYKKQAHNRSLWFNK